MSCAGLLVNLALYSATILPRPPIVECSSTVTIILDDDIALSISL